MADGQGFCPFLSKTFILPRRIRLDPREKEAKGGVTMHTVGVQHNISAKEMLANPNLNLPTTTQIPVPIPMVPYTGYVEYQTKDGKVTAEADDDDFHVVPVFPPCQRSDCEAWLPNAQRCGAIQADTPNPHPGDSSE